MEIIRLSEHEERIGKAVVNAAYKIHKQLGPGLLEKVYETCMIYELTRQGFNVKSQAKIQINYDGLVMELELRADLIIDDLVIVENKAVEKFNPLWTAQLLSHLKLSKLRLGYLINFNVVLIKQGISRYIN